MNRTIPCPECGKPMQGKTYVERIDPGEHFMCASGVYWCCPNVWCDGEHNETAETWNEEYDGTGVRDDDEMLARAERIIAAS